MPFYKKNEDGSFAEANNIMCGAYILLTVDKAKYKNKEPVDGWQWFDKIDDMYTAFKIPKPLEIKETTTKEEILADEKLKLQYLVDSLKEDKAKLIVDNKALKDENDKLKEPKPK